MNEPKNIDFERQLWKDVYLAYATNNRSVPHLEAKYAVEQYIKWLDSLEIKEIG